MDAKMLLQAGFDRALSGLELFEFSEGRARARLTVNDSVKNYLGTLHGGAIATLVDDIGTIAVFTADRYRRVGVTTDLHVSYLGAARADESVLIEAEVLQCGLNMAFVEVTLRREPRGELIARGLMTKFLGNGRQPQAAGGA